MKLIRNFKEFRDKKILDKNNYSTLESYLLLESNVVYSEKFRRVLTKMGEDKVAKNLLAIENKDLEVISNYFDVKADNENMVTFTPDRVAQEVLSSKKELVRYTGGVGGWLTNNAEANKTIFTALGYEPKQKEVFNPGNTEIGEIIGKYKSEKTGKTWVYVKFPAGEGIYNETKLVDATPDLKKVVFSKSRQEIRIGRVVRLLLTANNVTGIADAEIEKFVNDFRATLKIMNDIFSNFAIVDGNDLGFWYHKRNYLEPNKGNLGSSCQAVGRLDWLEIYIKNPQTVKLVILKSPDNPDKILGRALLWNLDDGSKLMDYIYTSKDSDEKIFKDFAKHNGWHLTRWNDGENLTFTATLNPGRFDKMPSIDTMNNWDPATGKISSNYFPGSERTRWTEDHNDEDENEYEDEDNYDDDDY